MPQGRGVGKHGRIQNGCGMFDAVGYFTAVAQQNKALRQGGFLIGRTAGAEGINDIVANWKANNNFFLIDDTTAQATYSKGVTYFRRSVYTCYILMGYRFDDAQEREGRLKECRAIFQQIHSRMIKDKRERAHGEDLEWLNVQNVFSSEFPAYSFQGQTGLYFIVENEEPTDLTYNPAAWQ